MIEIPLLNLTYAHDIKISLEDTIFIFRFDYNTVEDFWYLSILDDEENYIISSIKLVSNYELLQNFNVEGMPAGQLFLYDPEDDTGSTDPDIDNLYTRFKLIYALSSEVS